MLVTATAATAALAPGAAIAAERHAVTVESTARTSADGSRAVLSGTYTCEGYTGTVRLKVSLRTDQSRPLTPAETATVQHVFQWLGVPGVPVPTTSSSNNLSEQSHPVSCDGSATPHRWESTFYGPGAKGSKAKVKVTLTGKDPRTAEVRNLAETAGEVTFA
ncbi:hypothetical protein ACFVYR_28790 [Streptomyces sp. NPDC058284]|uniref:hypothetical protein n=1 Tax=unclassified Streptomyces TaxID=2593676 RepID=UPI0036486AB4